MINRVICVTVGLIGLLSAVSAQPNMTLQVSAAAGGVKVGDTCPSPPDSAVYAQIQAAIECAPEGALIEIARGTYPESLTLSKPVTLQGEDNTATIILSDAEQPVIRIGERVQVSLYDLTLTGGANDYGGGIYMPIGGLFASNLIIQRNTATLAGGGIYLGDVTATIENSVISLNSVTAFATGDSLAEALGGGVYIGEGRLQLSNVTLAENAITASGCGASAPKALGSALYSETAEVAFIEGSQDGSAMTSLCGGEASLYTDADSIIAVAPDLLRSAPFEDTRVVAIAPESTAEPNPSLTVLQPTTGDDAEIAVVWMDTLMSAVRTERLSPPVASRVYAYGGVTLYEAILHGRPDKISLTGTFNGGLSIPAPEIGQTYDWSTVANAALHQVSVGLFPTATPETLSTFDAVRDEINGRLGETVPVNVFNRSVAYGEQVGTAILAWAAQDNYAATRPLTYVMPTGDPTYWKPLDGQKALEPYWGVLRPFALTMPNDCEIAPTIQPDVDPQSAFYAEAREVYDMVVNLTPEQRAIALYWADNPGETATPPGHWVSIVSVLVESNNLSLQDAADIYTQVNISLADAFIAAWHTKYRENWVRPVTFIHDYMDADFQTVVGTPPFPEYPSGHSVASGAAAAVLKGLLGDIRFEDTTHLSRGIAPRTFETFEQAAQEAALSRLYGGIHYRASIEIGLDMGRCIGSRVLERVADS